jgi:hypothetical protein
MFDGTHFIIQGITPSEIQEVKEFKEFFTTTYNISTGEYIESNMDERIKIWITKNYEIHFNGSLHKNKDEVNSTDFNYMDLFYQIKWFCITANVSPYRCKVLSQEFGVNLKVKNARKIIYSFISHKNSKVDTKHEKDGGLIKYLTHKEYAIYKVYDKLPETNQLLRFEFVQKRKTATSDLKIYTLADMLSINNHEKLNNYLLNAIKTMIIIEEVDESLLTPDEKLLMNRKHPEYWEGLSQSKQYNRRKIELRKIERLNNRYGTGLRNELLRKVSDKCNALQAVSIEELRIVQDFLSKYPAPS